MAATKHLIVRVTKNQFERIKLNAQATGFVSISEYIRSLALEKDMHFQNRFNKLYSKVVGEEPLSRNKMLERPLMAYMDV